MAKLTYLELVNRVLKRITQTELPSGVSSADGHAQIIAEMINEAQNELWSETTNWHSLYKQRAFDTVFLTADTIAFVDSDPDTITDSGSGFGSFEAGMTIMVSGSTSNDGIYLIATAAAGTLTLQAADSLTAESAGDTVTIYAVTYPLATDHGRTIDLVDLTNDKILIEDVGRSFDEDDPNMDSTNDAIFFAIQGDQYRLYYIPNGIVKILDRYWKVPTTLSADSDTSDLPLFCENFLIHWAWMSICEYLNKFEVADRLRLKLYSKNGILNKAMVANKRVLNQVHRFQPTMGISGIHPPRFPSAYGARYY